MSFAMRDPKYPKGGSAKPGAGGGGGGGGGGANLLFGKNCLRLATVLLRVSGSTTITDADKQASEVTGCHWLRLLLQTTVLDVTLEIRLNAKISVRGHLFLFISLHRDK